MFWLQWLHFRGDSPIIESTLGKEKRVMGNQMILFFGVCVCRYFYLDNWSFLEKHLYTIPEKSINIYSPSLYQWKDLYIKLYKPSLEMSSLCVPRDFFLRVSNQASARCLHPTVSSCVLGSLVPPLDHQGDNQQQDIVMKMGEHITILLDGNTWWLTT